MNIVSSPEIVPITSGQRAVSMATATLCAEPDGGPEYGEVGASGRNRAHELLERRKILRGRHTGLRQHVAIAELRDAEFAQVSAHARLGCGVAVLAQHGDQLRLAPDRLLANDLRERGAPRRRIGIGFADG